VTLRTNKRGRGGQSGVTLMELLVGMIITTIITTMLLMGYFSLQSSYSYSVNSAEARDLARTGMSRVIREIRSAQTPTDAYYVASGFSKTSTAGMAKTASNFIAFFSTFNTTAAMPIVQPRLIVYRLYSDGSLWRYVDANSNGLNGALGKWSGFTSYTLNKAYETTHWEGAQLVVPHVVNGVVPSEDSPTPLFEYTYYDTSGRPTQQPLVTGFLRQGIVAVQIHLLVDMNPKHSPTYIDLLTTAQLRNAR
jgi:hypothetical protein